MLIFHKIDNVFVLKTPSRTNSFALAIPFVGNALGLTFHFGAQRQWGAQRQCFLTNTKQFVLDFLKTDCRSIKKLASSGNLLNLTDQEILPVTFS